MEIERKFLIEKEYLPKNLEQSAHNELEQAYIITDPVLRIRKKDLRKCKNREKISDY